MARKTVYYSLISELEKRISRMNKGDFLPAEQLMADEFRVSKPTLRLALAELAERGLIVTTNGVGSFVAEEAPLMAREIVFLCNNISFYSMALNVFCSEAARRGYLALAASLAEDRQAQERLIRSVLRRNPAGMVIFGDPKNMDIPVYRELQDSGTAAVFVIRTPPGCNDFSLLEFEVVDAISRIVCDFYRSGCRKIALFESGQMAQVSVDERVSGYLDGLRRCRLRPRPKLQCVGGNGVDEFLELFRSSADSPDAVCCLNDCSAAILIHLLRKKGINAEKIRFSGFDNLPSSKFFPYRLLTVSLPMQELGCQALDMIVRQIENRSFGAAKRKVAVELVETGGAAY